MVPPAGEPPAESDALTHGGDSASSEVEDFSETETRTGGGGDARGRSRVERVGARTWSFVRGGLTPTVIVLVALAAGGFAAAWALHPATGYPQPYPSVVELIFAPSHPARSPISVSVQLVRDYPATVTLNIHLAGADLAHRGWSLTAHVPSGVHVIGAQGNNPRTGQISQFGGDAETVYADPGAQPEREFDMVLGWSDLHSGPLQMRGPDLHAILPDVSVRNEVRPGTTTPVPRARYTVSRDLTPEGDFVIETGSSPDRVDPDGWYWRPVPGSSLKARTPLNVEAQSPTRAEQARGDDFLSGIVFGLAAAALIAAIQEFVNAATKQHRNTPNHSTT